MSQIKWAVVLFASCLVGASSVVLASPQSAEAAQVTCNNGICHLQGIDLTAYSK